MKALLVAINAKYIHSNPAVYSLAAYARENGIEDSGVFLEIEEYTINNRIDSIIADIYKKKPELLAFSCYIWNIDYVFKLTKELKKLLPNTDLWLGGPEVSYDSEEVLRNHEEITGVMVGEGEETFVELINYYRKKCKITDFEINIKMIKKIRGITIRDIDASIISTLPGSLTDMSKLPFLYKDLNRFQNRIIYYETSRGCPFSCSYCLSSIDKKVRMRDLDIVKSELKFFLDSKVNQVKLVDRTFNCNKNHAMTIWKYIKEHDNNITNFHFEIAADILDEEELEIINSFRPGAVQLEIGVQSTNETTIKEIDRIMNIDKLSNVVDRILQGANVHVHLDLIAGLPYEDLESFKKSFNDVYNMKPHQLQLGFLKVLKGSKIHKKAKEYGIVYMDYAPYEVLFTKWISYEEILRLKLLEEMLEIYYNSNQFSTTLPLLVREFESPFDFYEELAEYYEAKGYFKETPSRIYRYNVLLDFTSELLPQKLSLIREALVMDVYLREKAKTRPDFAYGHIPKERAVAFFKREAMCHKYLKEKEYENMDSKALERMSHIEVVNYDFTTGERLDKENYLLFNYYRRNPLTHEASVTKIDL